MKKPLSEGEISVLQETFSDLPEVGRFDQSNIHSKCQGNGTLASRITQFIIEYDLIDFENYANPLLKDNGRQYKKLGSHKEFIKWYKKEQSTKDTIKFISKYWWIPILASFLLTAGWDLYKHKFWESKSPESGKEQRKVQSSQNPLIIDTGSLKKTVSLPIHKDSCP